VRFNLSYLLILDYNVDMEHVAKKSNTLALMERYHLRANKKYGQNFLVDENIIQKIIKTADLSKQTCVIEIGPGIGSLSEAAAHQAGRVICYEIDENLRSVLEETLGEYEHVSVVFQDFLTVDLDQVIDHIQQSYHDICLLSNLPYYITTDLIRKVLLSKAGIDRMVVMVQKEVALKLCGEERSPLKCIIEYAGDCHYGFTVSKSVFIPAPHVDSAIMIINKERAIPASFIEVVEAAFKAKRKTIYNNMKPLFNDDTEAVLKRCGINKSDRAQQLSTEALMKLAKEREQI